VSIEKISERTKREANCQSAQLKKASNGFLSIGDDKQRQNQLPDPVKTASGFVLPRPAHWR